MTINHLTHLHRTVCAQDEKFLYTFARWSSFVTEKENIGGEKCFGSNFMSFFLRSSSSQTIFFESLISFKHFHTQLKYFGWKKFSVYLLFKILCSEKWMLGSLKDPYRLNVFYLLTQRFNDSIFQFCFELNIQTKTNRSKSLIRCSFSNSVFRFIWMMKNNNRNSISHKCMDAFKLKWTPTCDWTIFRIYE